MSFNTIIAIVLGLLKLANWITGTIDENKWRADERRKLILAETAELNARLTRVDVAIDTVDGMTAEERKKIAMED